MTTTAAAVPAVARAMTPREWALLVALSVLWGGSFFFIAVAVRELPPVTLVLARVALAAIALHLVVRATGHRLPTAAASWRRFAAMGLLNNVLPFTLIVWAQTRIPGGLASILNATTPLWGVLLAHFLAGDERLTPARLAGVLAGLAGVAALVGPGALAGGLDASHLAAEAAVLLAALLYALSGVYARRFRGLPAPVTAAGQLTAAALMLLPLALLVDRPWTLPAPGAATWAAVAALALLSTALAYVLFFRILATAGATNLLLVTLLIPVSALLLGAAFLGEAVEGRHLLGMALIGLGLAAIDGRPLRRLTRRG
jgi:drug/metabolite transporter (DMT)-like permease